MADHESTTDVACGEPELSPELRDALTLLRDRSDDEEFRTLVDDVLAGRRGLLDASATAAFGAAVFGRVVQEFNRRLDGLTEQERNAVAAEGQTQSAAMCAELHRRAISGEPAHSACGPCGGCTGICEALGTDRSC